MNLHAVRTVLFDIEGTLCSISFVKDVLFPYSLSALPEVLAQKWDDREFKPYRDAFPAEARVGPEELEAHVRDLTAKDLKVAALKNLQGYLWRNGYETGAFAAPLYPDVVPNLRDWYRTGTQLAIYSSGSVAAQKLLFQHVGVDGGDGLEHDNDADPDKVNVEPSRESSSAKRKSSSTGSSPQAQKALKTDTQDEVNGSASKEENAPSAEKAQFDKSTGNSTKVGESHEEEAKLAEPATEPEPEEDSAANGSKEEASGQTAAPKKQPTSSLDITYLFDGYFDTVNAGLKTEKESYVKIAAALGRKREEVLFLSDNVLETRAALAANMRALVVTRPGNLPLSEADKEEFQIISSLDEVHGLPGSEK